MSPPFMHVRFRTSSQSRLTANREGAKNLGSPPSKAAETEDFPMSIRWMLVLLVAFVVTDCGSSKDSDSCQAGYTSQRICTACGPGGGCGRTEVKCARTCS